MEGSHSFHSFSPVEKVQQIEVEIQEWLYRDKKDQDLVVQKWLDSNTRGLIKEVNAKMLEKKHWLEAIDPLHRYGSNLFLYLKSWEKSKSPMSFFDWLDHGDGRGKDVERCGRQMLDEHKVSYLQTQVERQGFEVIAKNEKIYYKRSENPLDTKEDEQWIYVLSPWEKLYIGKKEKGSFHHSTFLAGGPVLAAGFIQVSDGYIKGLSWSSGHYLPTKQNFDRLIRFLEKEHVDLSFVTISPSIKGLNFV